MELFGNNFFAIFLITVIVIISYSNFEENQHIFLIYLFTYAAAAMQIFRIRICLCLLLVSTFFYLEYLSSDKIKLEIITKFHFKIADYLYLLFIQYHFLLVFLSFVVLHIGNLHEKYYAICLSISLVLLFIGEHKVITQPFKTKNISQIYQVFSENPDYSISYNTELLKRLKLLCYFEDKTYFYRKNSYNSFSREYFSQAKILSKLKIYIKSFFRRLKVKPKEKSSAAVIKEFITSRGFSTPEMQLIRTIGIERGYNKVLRRKLFEILYSTLFFSSLKAYKSAHSVSVNRFREYILVIYLQSVFTKIRNRPYNPLSSLFQSPSEKIDIEKWSMEGLFVACLGLSFRIVSTETLWLYRDVIKEFSLDDNVIRELATNAAVGIPFYKS